jgi:DNA polymerase III delta prime subunit
MTTVIFHSPAATGKTKFGQALARHFGCSAVVEAEELLHMADSVRKHKLPNALILCINANDVEHSPYIRARRTLHRDEMNRAMVAVGGIPIWNDDGSVNTMGKRKELKA